LEYILSIRGDIMSSVLIQVKEVSLGHKARKLRISEHLTRHDLAAKAGVSISEVESFERGLPLPLDSRRRILRVLWARKVLQTASGKASKARW
jgi:DNA-binding transcriptional regulator YiaG